MIQTAAKTPVRPKTNPRKVIEHHKKQGIRYQAPARSPIWSKFIKSLSPYWMRSLKIKTTNTRISFDDLRAISDHNSLKTNNSRALASTLPAWGRPSPPRNQAAHVENPELLAGEIKRGLWAAPVSPQTIHETAIARLRLQLDAIDLYWAETFP